MKPGAPSLQSARSYSRFCEQVRRLHYNFKFVTINVIEFVFSTMEQHSSQQPAYRLPTLPPKT